MVSGAALVIQRLAEGLADLDHAILVLSAGCEGASYSKYMNNLQVVRLNSFRNLLRVDQNFVVWSQEKICEELQKFQPDIMHTHDPLNLGLAAVRAGEKVDAQIVFTIHQLPWFITSYLPLQARLKQIIEGSIWRYSRWFMKQCDGLITPSKKIAKIIETNTGFMPQVISNGVDLNLFSPQGNHEDEVRDLCLKYQLCPDDPVILYVGRIDPDKRVDLVIKAAAKVMQKIKTQLFVVGDGTQREDLIQLSQSLGILENCCFPGFISKHEGLPGIYRLATVFATASEIEIQSSVVLEAFASGLPVVTVDASSMPEFVIDGKNGFLVPPGNLDQFAAKLLFLIQNNSARNRMRQVARLFAETHSNTRFLTKHEEFYTQVIKFIQYKNSNTVMA